MKISRTTNDGAYSLTQTFSKVGGGIPAAEITMSLKNNSAAHKTVYLVRWALLNPIVASYDSNQCSAWGYIPKGSGIARGLMIEEIGQPSVPYGFQGIDQSVSTIPDPCNPTASDAGYQASHAGSIVMAWNLTLGSLRTGTVKAKYSQF